MNFKILVLPKTTYYLNQKYLIIHSMDALKSFGGITFKKNISIHLKKRKTRQKTKIRKCLRLSC